MIKKFNHSNFLIVGITRNSERLLYKQVLKIHQAFTGAESLKWLIIESDSEDNTINTLENLKNHVNLNYISLGYLQKQYPKRTERIAFCRNRYLDEINFNPFYKNVDFVVVVDLDGVNSDLNSTSVKSCWQVDVEWDACFANQSAPYYDIYALRHDIWSPNDCNEYCDFLKKKGKSRYDAEYSAIWSRMIQINKYAEPIKVKSAFGGLGIYKKEILNQASYYGLNSNGEECCEHVSLNYRLYKNKYNLYIMPSLINSGWNEHNLKLKFFRKLILKLKYFLLR